MDLTEAEDIVTCSYCGVVTGYVHFLSFVWVNEDGLGGLSNSNFRGNGRYNDE